MPSISSFLYCDEAIFDETRAKPEIGELIDVIQPDFIPGNFSFTVVFSLMGVSAHHDLKVAFIDPESGAVLETDELPLEANVSGDLPDEAQGVFVVFELKNVPLEYEGIYTTYIFLDGEILGEYPIPVVKWKGVEFNDDDNDRNIEDKGLSRKETDERE
ncbi:TPA: hypothetical protein VBX77_001768 [Yersinia enterocolitica]|nr:hypothetical protein [Yersinia enterocolitica]